MKSRLLAFLLIAFTSGMAYHNAAAQDGKIAGLPAALSVHEDQIFEIGFYVNPGSSPVSVIDFILNYDAEFLQAIEIVRVEGPLDMNQISPEIKEADGQIFYGAFKLKSPWPAAPFQLVKVRFKALKEVDRTMLHHSPEEFPNTSMAFEGYNTMAVAAPTEIKILKKDMASGTSANLEKTTMRIDRNSGQESIAVFFTVKEAMRSRLILREKNGNQLGVLYDHQAFPGVLYNFKIDGTVLPDGNYQIEFVSPDGEYSEEFNTTGS